MLVEEAENWWEHTSKLLEAEHIEVTWEVFKKHFLEKYFPEDIRKKKEIEFLELKQGKMSVGEYAAKFEELIKYSPYYRDPDEHSKCVKFESGLRPEIKVAIGYQGIRSFPQLVNMCRTYENDLKMKEAHEKTLRAEKGYGPIRNNKEPQRTEEPYPHPRRTNGSSKTNIDGKYTVAGTPQCSTCQKFHPGNCWYQKEPNQRGPVCFNCNKIGHIARSCPEKVLKKEMNAIQTLRGRNTAQRRETNGNKDPIKNPPNTN